MKKISKIVCNKLANSEIIPWKIRRLIYKNTILELGQNSEIRPNCFFNSEYVKIGNGSFINYNTQFHSGYNKNAQIILKNNVYVGMNVVFCTVSHELGDSTKRAGENTYGEIIVNQGTWIGANTIVLPGITIGEGCVIGAGSVVNKDCEPNMIYAGNPAVIKGKAN